MFEVGQVVRIRERTWEVLNDHAASSSHDHMLHVRGLEREVRGQERVFIYRPGTEQLLNNESQADDSGLESVIPLPSPELAWQPHTLPSRWERLHTAYRLSIVHQNGYLLGLARARLKFEPYQLAPVLKVMTSPRQRFLLAEDVGMGKTIEAGLILTELMARSRADRILIVVPAALQDQWKDEMHDKFGIAFNVLDNDYLTNTLLPRLYPGANPWNYESRVITSIDFAKQERILRALKQSRWDVIVVDEAHYLGEGGTDHHPQPTDRSRFGQELAKLSESLLLLTATPHNGYSQGFYSLLRLLDDTRFASPDTLRRESIEQVVIRRSKQDIFDDHGQHLYQKRLVSHIELELSPAERKLYTEITKYANQQWKNARGNNNTRLIVGFAMTLLKKRFISSLRAIQISLQTRLDTLSIEKIAPDAKSLVSYRRRIPLTEKQNEQVERQLMSQTAEHSEEALQREKQRVKRLLELANSIPVEQDYKAARLKRELDRFCNGEQPRKVIVFTEYKDTLDYLKEYLEERGYAGRIVVMHGHLNRTDRLRAENQFHQLTAGVLLATDAASEGLNFQDGCWTVIHNELPWNPNRLEQRNGRVDRYGQARQVEVYNMVVQDTLEARILQVLEEKLRVIRDELGGTSDVLSMVSNFDLDTMLMDASVEHEDVALAIQATEAKITQDLSHSQNTLQTYLKQLNLEPGIFGQEAYRQIREVRSRTEQALPDGIKLEDFVLSTLKALAGNAQAVTGLPHVWSLDIPPALRRTGVERHYKQVTFIDEVALSEQSRPPEIEYISLGHPLIESLIATIKSDAREGGQLAGRMAIRILPAATPGLLFTFLSRWLDGNGATIVEEIVPFFVDLEQTVKAVSTPQSAHEQANQLLAQTPSRKNAPPELLTQDYEPHWKELTLIARQMAKVYCQQCTEQIRLERVPQLEMLQRDLARWSTERITWYEHKISTQNLEDKQAVQLGLFEGDKQRSALAARETRRKNQLKLEKEFILHRRQEREEEIRHMQQIFTSQPELIGVLVVVPEENC